MKNEPTGLPLNTTAEQHRAFRMLEARVRELEHVVHRLMKDRVSQDEADAWLGVEEGQNLFSSRTMTIKGRGQRLALAMDRWPDQQKWQDDPS